MVPFGFGFGFDAMSAVFPIFFIIFAGVFVFVIAKGIGQWSKNNQSPIIPVYAKVSAKRQDVSHHSTGMAGDMHNTGMHTSTSYYATFEFENGERMELCVGAAQYGQLAEGDVGKLEFQGTRFKSFTRER